MLENDYYIQLHMYDEKKCKVIHSWNLPKGNLAFVVAVAQEYAKEIIPKKDIGHINVYILIRNDITNTTVFERSKTGDIFTTLNETEEFVTQKLGFSLHRQVSAVFYDQKHPENMAKPVQQDQKKQEVMKTTLTTRMGDYADDISIT